MNDLTPAQADALLRWIMECNDTPLQLPIGSNPTPMTLEEPAMTSQRIIGRAFSAGFLAAIALLLLGLLLLSGCAAPRPAGWSDENAHITVAPDGTMALCTTVRVLPAEE